MMKYNKYMAQLSHGDMCYSLAPTPFTHKGNALHKKALKKGRSIFIKSLKVLDSFDEKTHDTFLVPFHKNHNNILWNSKKIL